MKCNYSHNKQKDSARSTSLNSKQRHTSGNIYAEKIRAIIHRVRQKRKQTLRSVCNEFESFYSPLKLAPSTLLAFEKRGPSKETMRLLLLHKLYGISINSNTGNYISQDIPEFVKSLLREESDFWTLCVIFSKLKPGHRRNVLHALVKVLEITEKTKKE